MKPYKMKPNTTVYKGNTLKLINGQVAPQPIFTRMFPSNFTKGVESGEISLDTKWKRHDYKIFKAALGSRHFIGVAAEYKVSGKRGDDQHILAYDWDDVFEKDGTKKVYLVELPTSIEDLTDVSTQAMGIGPKIEYKPDAKSVMVKFVEREVFK